MYQQLRRFLVIEEVEQNEKLGEILFLQMLNKRGFDQVFDKEINKAISGNAVHSSSNRTVQDFLIQFQLQEAQYFHLVRRRIQNHNLQEVLNGLDGYYFLLKLRYQCEIVSYSSVLDLELGQRLIEDIRIYCEKSPFFEHFLFQAYLKIYDLLKSNQAEIKGEPCPNRSTEIYHTLEKLLKDNAKTLSEEEMKTLHNFMQNYCIQRISFFPDEGFEEQLDRLYNYRLDMGTLLVNGWLPPQDFKNRATLLLRLGKLNEAQNFIDQYQDRIAPNFRSSAVAFNLGHLYFYRQDFGKMRLHLQAISDRDPYYMLDYKSLMIKAYFKEKDWSALRLQLDSLRIYLRRDHSLPESRYLGHKNRLKFFNRLFRVMEKGIRKPTRIKKIKDEIEGCSPLVDKSFLLKLLADFASEIDSSSPPKAPLS